jgi:hypothetical protein
VFGHSGFVWLLHMDVALVLLASGLNGTAGLLDIN